MRSRNGARLNLAEFCSETSSGTPKMGDVGFGGANHPDHQPEESESAAECVREQCALLGSSVVVAGAGGGGDGVGSVDVAGCVGDAGAVSNTAEVRT